MRALLLGTAVFALLVHPVHADLRLSQTFEEISERGRVPRSIFSLDDLAFSLIVPSTWRLTRMDSEQQLVAYSLPKLHAHLQVEFDESTPQVLSPAALSRELLNQIPNSRLIDQTKCFAAGAEGVQLEIEFTAASGERYRKRVGYFYSGGQRFEISLMAPAPAFEKIHSGWTSVLNSFRSETSAAVPPDAR